jgi:hypothetical protein
MESRLLASVTVGCPVRTRRISTGLREEQAPSSLAAGTTPISSMKARNK